MCSALQYNAMGTSPVRNTAVIEQQRNIYCVGASRECKTFAIHLMRSALQYNASPVQNTAVSVQHNILCRSLQRVQDICTVYCREASSQTDLGPLTAACLTLDSTQLLPKTSDGIFLRLFPFLEFLTYSVFLVCSVLMPSMYLIPSSLFDPAHEIEIRCIQCIQCIIKLK